MNLSALIHKIDLDPDTVDGGNFDLLLQGAVVLSLVSFSVSTIPDLSEVQTKIVNLSELVCIAIFTLEYLIRFVQAKQKTKFVFSFFGMIDLLAILPFFLATQNMAAFRSLRLLRLFRALKLARYNKAVNRFQQAFFDIKELVVYLTCVLLFFFVSSALIYQCEHEAQPDKFGSIFLSMWWTIITLSTVGYGDVYPVTILGRVFTGLILLVGLGTVPIPSGLIATALMRSVNGSQNISACPMCAEEDH